MTHSARSELANDSFSTLNHMNESLRWWGSHLNESLRAVGERVSGSFGALKYLNDPFSALSALNGSFRA